ncbi:MFS transporter [Labedella phragmitis]|uniref:MFS transporter n=1 Tax=Labedella phragmitis TaxID=2498849 RepID=A0A3S3Z8M4_9MICO|nr:MFS transporter [Labedella phragmitis]RWZ51174.1 MFS transporter [Labedella phragmitis]
MAAAPPPGPSRQERRARAAVNALFLTNGALIANVVPRYPEIKADLGVDNAAYGIAIAASAAGAIIAGLGAAAVLRRFGSARAAVAGTMLTALATVVVAFAPSLALFAAALLISGALDSITDVAQNSHGLRVQRRYGRSILNSFHATWSIGAVLGGVMAAGAIALGVPRQVHLPISAAIFAVVALVALRFCLPGPDTDDAAEVDTTPGAAARAGLRPRTVLLLLALVAVAISGIVVEDAGFSWATLYLDRDLAASSAVAAWGFIALVGAQFVGRLLGDGFVNRFGQVAVARVGGVIAAVGMGSALLFPSVPGTIAGFAAAGFGVATLIPAAMHQADGIPGLRAGTGLTIVSWLMRLGFLLSPPIVGLIADASSLRVGLVLVPLAGVVTLFLAGVLGPRRRGTTGQGEAPAA